MNKHDVNQRIADRTDCFYWQTDRKISTEETKEIWLDRHSAISNEDLLKKINSLLIDEKLEEIYPINPNAQTSLGNINSVRVGRLTNGKEVIIRCHPRGIKNGYFHVESLAAKLAIDYNLPSYNTYLIHDLENDDDISFQMIEKLDGKTAVFHLKEDPDSENGIVYEMGKTLAKINSIKVNGFGPFDNEKAKMGELVGTHNTQKEAVLAGLYENIDRLVTYSVIDENMAKKMRTLFETTSLFDNTTATLVHNDFVDWNVITNGNAITGILDWDECVGGCLEEEIACWSTFFTPQRLENFLNGYFSVVDKPDNFEDKLNIFKLRYVISKMALRVKRLAYDSSDFLKTLIENGKTHLNNLIKIFELDK